MRLVRFIRADSDFEKAIWLNPDHVISLEVGGIDVTDIWTANAEQYDSVKGAIDDVARALMGARGGG